MNSFTVDDGTCGCKKCLKCSNCLRTGHYKMWYHMLCICSPLEVIGSDWPDRPVCSNPFSYCRDVFHEPCDDFRKGKPLKVDEDDWRRATNNGNYSKVVDEAIAYQNRSFWRKLFWLL